MRAFLAVLVAGVSLIGPVELASAQPYGGRDYGYGDRDYGSRDRGYDSRGRGGYDYDDRGPQQRRRERGDYAFDEREYLRCNPDVRKAIVNGQMESGLAHYRTFGRREGRRLTC